MKELEVKVNQMQSNDQYQAVKYIVYITSKIQLLIVKKIYFTFYFDNILFVR